MQGSDLELGRNKWLFLISGMVSSLSKFQFLGHEKPPSRSGLSESLNPDTNYVKRDPQHIGFWSTGKGDYRILQCNVSAFITEIL
jgi:hypothetical protein